MAIVYEHTHIVRTWAGTFNATSPRLAINTLFSTVTKLSTVGIAAVLLLACSSTPGHMPEDFAEYAADLEKRSLEDIIERYPEAREELDRAAGYAIFLNHTSKLPVVGSGEGFGVAVNLKDDRRHYLTVTHFDVGGGVGDLTYRLVIVFFQLEDFERLRTGRLHVGASVNTAYGGEFTGYSASGSEKRAFYILSDSGGGASWVLRVVHFKPLVAD